MKTQSTDGPLMLSDLIKAARKALREHGDMPVGVETCVAGYEHNEEHSQPAEKEPAVDRARWIGGYWKDRGFEKSFTVRGL